MTTATATPALTVDLAEATTALAQARVALTTEARNAHLDTVQECTGWALAEPAARRLYNEAAWLR